MAETTLNGAMPTMRRNLAVIDIEHIALLDIRPVNGKALSNGHYGERVAVGACVRLAKGIMRVGKSWRRVYADSDGFYLWIDNARRAIGPALSRRLVDEISENALR